MLAAGIMAAAAAAACAAVHAADASQRWLEILASNPGNAEALARALETLPREKWPEIATTLQREPSATAQVALADYLLRSGGQPRPVLEKLRRESLTFDDAMRAGAIWMALGEVSQARELWLEAVQRSPHPAAAWARAAEAAEKAGAMACAAEFWDRARHGLAPPQRLEALEKLASLHEALGQADLAADFALEAWEMLSPGHWKFPYAAARALALAEAAGKLEDLAGRWNPRDPASLRRQAALEMWKRKPAEAAKALRLAKDKLPGEPALAEALGEAELAAGHPAEAAKALREAYLADPSPSRALRLAEALAMAGEEDAAEAVLNEGEPDPALRRKALEALGLHRALERHLLRFLNSEQGLREWVAFLLQRGRDSEALEASAALPALEAAKIFFRHLRLTEAEKLARQAAAPQNPESILLLADILEARGQCAVEILRTAVESSPSPALEQRLLEAIRRAAPDEAAARATLREEAQRRWRMARKINTPEAWLRASRWIEAMEENPIPVLQEASQKLENPLQILLELARVQEAQGDPAAAIQTLEAAHRIHPALDLARDFARLEMLRGQPEAAAHILARLARQNPDDASLARSLAEAQEAAGNSFDALDWWLRAFDLSPPLEKVSLLRPTLACFSRLGLSQRALDFLHNALAQISDESLREDLARQIQEFVRSHHLEAEWQSRHTNSPLQNQAPTQLNTAKNLQIIEKKSLIESYSKAWRDKNWEECVKMAQRLVVLPPADGEDELRLARALERAGRMGEAAQQWERCLTRFSRMQSVLLEAAEFFEKVAHSPKALRLRLQASRLGALPAPLALKTAREAEPGEARRILEELVRLLPDDPGKSCLPFPRRLARPYSADGQLRDWALFELGLLRVHTRQELEELAGGSPTGLIWACAGAGFPCASMALPLAKKFPDAFSALALEEENYGLLKEWISSGESESERWQRVAAVSTMMLAQGWRPDLTALVNFFSEAPAFARWTCAEGAASCQHYRLAAAVAPNPSALEDDFAPQAALTIASWHLSLLDPQGALNALSRASRPAWKSFEDPYYEALRLRTALSAPVLVGVPSEPPAVFLASALVGNRASMHQSAHQWSPGVGALRQADLLEQWGLTDAATILLAESWRSVPEPQIAHALALLRLPAMPSEKAAALAYEWAALGASENLLLAASRRATSLGAYAAAEKIAEATLAANPTSDSAWAGWASLELPPSPRLRQLFHASAPGLSEGIAKTVANRMKSEVEQAPAPPSPESHLPRPQPKQTPLVAQLLLDGNLQKFFLQGPSAHQLTEAAEALARERPDIVQTLDPDSASRFFPWQPTPRSLQAEISWALLRKDQPSLEKRFEQLARRGERLGWEGLLRLRFHQGEPDALLIEDFLQNSEPSPATCAALANELLEKGHRNAARAVLDFLEKWCGLPTPELHLAALTLETDSSSQNDREHALELWARIEPKLRPPLAEWFQNQGESSRAQKLLRSQWPYW